MIRRLFIAAPLVFSAIAAVACGPEVNLSQALEMTDVLTGWYDNGIKECAGPPTIPGNTCSQMVPSVIFRLHNRGTAELSRVQLTVSFWRDGEDGAYDELLLTGIGAEGLKPSASTNAVSARAHNGHTIEGSRGDLFARTGFKDVTVKLFAQKSGEMFPIGQIKIDRRILAHQ